MTDSIVTISLKAALIAAFCIGGLLSAEFAHAQSAVPSATNSVPRATDVYDVFQLDTTETFGDFVVGPGKFDLTIAPGESQVVEILVTNRAAEERVFSLTTEDITGSQDSENPTVLLGDERGPYTLRDYLSVAADRFIVAPGERVTVPITVSLPADAEPGGRYGTLLVQTTTQGQGVDVNRPSAAVVSRIAVLFFVSTPGELDQAGSLIDFTTVPDKAYFTQGPIEFGLLYENTGTVHTTPAAEIVVTNMFGQEVGYLEVLPWFALPQSLRLREVVWERDSLLGYYTAEARVYRGYGDQIDTAQLSFWVIDWRLLVGVIVALLLLTLLIRFVSNRFTITRRDS